MDKDYDCSYKVYKVLRSKQIDKGGKNFIDLMIIEWNRVGKVVIENRRTYHRNDGGVGFRKLVGLDSECLQIIKDNLHEIESIMSGKKKLKPIFKSDDKGIPKRGGRPKGSKNKPKPKNINEVINDISRKAKK